MCNDKGRAHGMVCIASSCRVRDKNGIPTKLDFGAHYGVFCATASTVKIQFQDRDGAALPSPLRLGISHGSNDRTKHLRIEVDPESAIGTIQVSASDQLSLSNIAINGKFINFDVAGLQKSDPETPGDARITATDPTGVTPPQTVSVVVPAEVATPHDCSGSGGPVNGRNYAENATTAPAQPNIPPGQVVLVTAYYLPLQITVHDQFHQLVGDIYDGAAITETIQAGGIMGAPINATLNSSSTYTDRVGADWKPQVNPIAGWPTTLTQQGIVPAGSEQANAWLSSQSLPMQDHEEVQIAGVEVDGFPLNPGIVDRRVKISSSAQTILLDWQCGSN
jgi:hypothetical protein